MYGQSGSYGIPDPSIGRLVEETVNSVEDVERRLTNLKLGIAQTFPHLAPILQAREAQHRDQNAFVLARLASPLGSPMQGFGGPQLGQFPQQQGQFGQPLFQQQPFGQNPYQAGIPNQIGNPYAQFGVPLQGGMVPSVGSPFRIW